MKHQLKRLVYPARKALGKFILPQPVDQTHVIRELRQRIHYLELLNSIIYNAGTLIAGDKIEGDYLEFGVYTGNSFVEAFRSLELAFKHATLEGIWNTERDRQERQEIWSRMRFFAFDSFQGLPEPKGHDTASLDFVGGKYACSRADFERNISQRGVPLERVRIVPGWFDETLNEATRTQYRLEHASIVNVDCDLYESAKQVLDFCTPLLVDGSVLIFDDWYNFRANPNLGEQRAFREWQNAHPEWIVTPYRQERAWRNSFIVNRA